MANLPDLFNDDPFKVIVIGEQGVGKTCFCSVYADDKFLEEHTFTCGHGYYRKMIEEKEGRKKFLNIWDFSGGEVFLSQTVMYYEKTYGCIIAFDVTDEESFKNVKKWYDSFRSKNEKSKAVFLVGNKVDLEEKRAVKTEDGENLAKELGMMYFEVSSKDRDSLDEMFLAMVEVLKKEGY